MRGGGGRIISVPGELRSESVWSPASESVWSPASAKIVLFSTAEWY